MQREIDELNRLKQNKNRKYSWLGQLAVYSQLVEVTLYLTSGKTQYLQFEISITLSCNNQLGKHVNM
jgi:hypothetical protein